MTKSRDEYLEEVLHHYDSWTEDMDIRMTIEDGWNDIIDAYWGKLPSDWPYDSRVTDPRIRTSLIEKKARLTNSKLRGRLTPREGGDVLRARLNNTLLDFQWDTANHGGTMNSKWGDMDMNTRVFGSSFALIPWHKTKTKSCNEFVPVLPFNVGLDPGCSHVRDAKWVQIRRWMTVEEMRDEGIKNLDEFVVKPVPKTVKNKRPQDRRDNAYSSRVLHNQGLNDRVGEDQVFPVYEIVTEYRVDKFIIFSPEKKHLFEAKDNPYNHKSIPVVQLRYYPLQDDPMGESEVRPVLPIWRAIQATLCGFLDSMNLHMRPPLKILGDSVQMETIEYSPEATWLMDRIDAVTEFQGSGEALKYFQISYSALVSAFNQAMGDMSQGVSNLDPFSPDKTATEVRATQKQQNVRDQNNQTYLAEAIQDMMRMWLSNNNQFLFEENNFEYVLRIVGKDQYNYFMKAGLHELIPDKDAMDEVQAIIEELQGQISDTQIKSMYEASLIPKYPVIENPNQRDPSKLRIKSKMSISDTNDSVNIYLVPDDLSGTYDYIADVKSMALGSAQELIQSRQQAINVLTTNPQVLQLLQSQGYQPNIKELFIDQFEDTGLRDSERYFEEISQTAGNAGATQATAGVQPPMGVSGVPEQPATTFGANAGQQMA